MIKSLRPLKHFSFLSVLILASCEIPQDLHGTYKDAAQRGELRISAKDITFESLSESIPNLYSKNLASDRVDVFDGLWKGKNKVYLFESKIGDKSYETFIAFSNLKLIGRKNTDTTSSRVYQGHSLAMTREKGQAPKHFFSTVKTSHQYTAYYSSSGAGYLRFGNFKEQHTLLFSMQDPLNIEDTNLFDIESHQTEDLPQEFEFDLNDHLIL